MFERAAFFILVSASRYLSTYFALLSCAEFLCAKCVVETIHTTSNHNNIDRPKDLHKCEAEGGNNNNHHSNNNNDNNNNEKNEEEGVEEEAG